MNFFFSRKNREKELKLKYKHNDHFLQTKAEKIEELEREEAKKTNELMKKLKNIEKRKKEILKHKMTKLFLLIKSENNLSMLQMSKSKIL